MTTFKSSAEATLSPADINEGSLRRVDTVWAAVQEQLSLHGKPEMVLSFLALFEKKQETMRRMKLSLDTPDGKGGEGLVIMANELNQLWDTLKSMLGTVYEVQISGAFNATSLDDAEREMQNQLGEARDENEGKGAQAILDDMEKVIQRLSVRTDDVLAGGTDTGYYAPDKTSGMLAISSQCDKDKENLERILRTDGIQPKTTILATNLLAALDKLRAIDAKNSNIRDVYGDSFGGDNADLRPVRIVAAAIGIPIVLLGLYQTLSGKGLSLVTVLWAIVTAFALKPNLLQSGGKYALDRMQQFDSADLRHLLSHGVRGESAAKAFEELQDMYQDPEKKKLLSDLRRSSAPIENGHIEALTGNTLSPLAILMEPLNEENRKKVLKVLGARKNDTDRELWVTYLQGAG